MMCRYFERFLLQGVDRNWRQACFFYLAPGLICEGYWQVNSRKSIFRIADPSIGCTVKIRAFPILPIMEIYTHPHTPMGVAFALRCI